MTRDFRASEKLSKKARKMAMISLFLSIFSLFINIGTLLGFW